MGPCLSDNPAMPLPQAMRRLAPDRLRYSVRLRALAVGSGLVPPRSMHSAAESALLAELARDRKTVVEIGVYEGSSAVVLAGALPADATLHLIDPFGANPTLLPGWAGVEGATRRVVARAARRRGAGPRVVWHVERSADTAARWSEPVDLVFIDGDHTEAGCRMDWELWSPLVAPGGVVLFHDAIGPDALPGPRAVFEDLFRADDQPRGWRIKSEVDTSVAVEWTGAAGA
jgi:predicted O-methyltransferase YrrM